MLKLFESLLLKALALLSWLVCPAIIIFVFFYIKPGGDAFFPFIFDFYGAIGDKIAELLHTSNWIIMLILVLLCIAASLGTCLLVLYLAFLCAWFLHENIWAASIDVYNSYCYDREIRNNTPHVERQTGREWKQKRIDEMDKKNAEASSSDRKQDEGNYNRNTYEYNYNENEFDKGYRAGYEQGRRQGMEDHYMSPEDKEFEDARKVFLLDDVDFSTVTLEDLDRQKKVVLKMAHPDASDDPRATANTQKINHYYDILKKHLSR